MVDTDRTGPADGPAWLRRARERHAWFDHLVRTGTRYTERHGNHYAAAITYFSVLAMVPILMVAFGVVGRVLVGDEQLQAHLRTAVARNVPPALVPLVDSVVDTAVTRGDVIGLVGLVVALYAGLGWMHNLREALSAQWDRPAAGHTSMLRRWSLDLVAMGGLGLAIAVSLGLAAAGSQASEQALGLLGLRERTGADIVDLAVGLALTLLANWLVFVWVLARLPRRPVAARSAMRAAVIGSVGLVVLQQGMNVYLRFVTVSSAWAAFGPILGLLVFANVVSRFVLLVTAWAATAERDEPEPPAPAPAVVRPAVTVSRSPSPAATVGLIGFGAAMAALGGAVTRRTGRHTTTAPEPQLGGRRRVPSDRT